MARNAYYQSEHWKDLRTYVLRRDGYKCQAPGCKRRATHVDHIKTRPNVDRPTEFDTPANCRSLCAPCDSEVKEAAGERKQGGMFKGADVNGWPFASR